MRKCGGSRTVFLMYMAISFSIVYFTIASCAGVVSAVCPEDERERLTNVNSLLLHIISL